MFIKIKLIKKITMSLINKSLLSKYSPLPKNYSFEEIMLYQPISIAIWVRPILGDAFTDALEYEVEHNQVSEANATLMTTGGLLQYLSYAMCYEGLPFIFAHFSEVGITLPDVEHSKSVDLKELNYIQDHLRRTLEFLKDNLIKWLDCRCSSFPLYHPTCNNSCCGNKGLNTPNPNWELFTPPRKNTYLK